MFMLQYANEENDFMKYALVLQDGFSKRIWLESLKDKTSEESIRPGGNLGIPMFSSSERALLVGIFPLMVELCLFY